MFESLAQKLSVVPRAYILMPMCFGWTLKAFCDCVLIQFSDLTFRQISTPLN